MAKELMILNIQSASKENRAVKTYDYSLTYCDKNLDIDADSTKERTSLVLYCKQRPKSFPPDEHDLTVNTQLWKNEKLIENHVSLTPGVIEDVISLHGEGIKAIEDFDNYLTNLLGSKSSVIKQVIDVDSLQHKAFRLILGGQDSGMKKEFK